MNLKEVLDLIADVAKNIGTSEPFIVGGMPRDKVLGRISEVQDVDITTGDDSINTLARAMNSVLKNRHPDVYMKTFPDGHSQINVDGMKIDFSSNFKSPQVAPMLNAIGVKPTPMLVELMSRDFTCNSLLMELDLAKIKDPVGIGITDIKNKIIKTPMPPNVTLTNDPKRIVRVIYLATKLEFEVEPAIISFVSKNPQLIQQAKPKYISDKFNEALFKDKDKTIRLITDMNLWPYIPITAELAPYYKASV